MASFIFDKSTEEFVDRDTYYAMKAQRAPAKVSDLPMPYIRGDLPTYISPVTGKPVEGRAARREDLARSGCREVDPSEYKPIYKDYEFCQKRRLPYMGDAVPPPMTRDEKMAARERRKAERAAERAADAIRAKAALAKVDTDLAKFKRGNTKDAPIFKNNTVKEA